jgi:VanZ family protein
LVHNGSPVSKWRWVSPVALAVMIFVVSGRSHVVGAPVRYSDKAAHFAVYGLLATLVLRAMLPSKPNARGRVALISILLASAYGISDEWHQSFTPGRAVEMADWFADTFGATFAVILYCRWEWYRRWLEMPVLVRRKRRLEKAELAGPISAP